MGTDFNVNAAHGQSLWKGQRVKNAFLIKKYPQASLQITFIPFSLSMIYSIDMHAGLNYR